MSSTIPQQTPNAPLVPDLSGLRIGLSGAIPEREEWGERALDWEILNAVTTLADTVFSGGKRHKDNQNRPGTREELDLARERDKPCPCFLLGGLGGMAAELSHQPQYRDLATAALPSANSWMPPEEQDRFIRTTSDYGRAIALIAERLAALRGGRWALDQCLIGRAGLIAVVIQSVVSGSIPSARSRSASRAAR